MAGETSCMELALEGERLCKAGDCHTGIRFFEAAVQIGTDDLSVLSAIYSQLGNAYFYLQQYGRALEYHRHDLNLARTIGDKLGEAKASGNLGNTLKVLGKFDEAIACCQRHLDISQDLNDKIGEARALYNLGNVYHARGKHVGRFCAQDPGEFPPQVKHSLQKAVEYYESNLCVVKELGDRAAQGRACGNLGNTHYLLGNFGKAIANHEERLAIAKEFGDKSAERRAYNNLGNAHIFLGQFDVAAQYYKRTLQIARQLGERALEAQACYSLGNTYTLLREYARAMHYHHAHLTIARDLHDRIGEGRAYWSIGNAHMALGDHQAALSFAAKHLRISQEIGDEIGEVTAEMNLHDLKTVLGIPAAASGADGTQTRDADKTGVLPSPEGDLSGVTGSSRLAPRTRRASMENMQLVSLTPDAKDTKNGFVGSRSKAPMMQRALSIATELPQRLLSRKCETHTDISEKKLHRELLDDENFFERLSRFQSRRIDDQRCSFEPAVGTDAARGRDEKIAELDKENQSPDTGIANSSQTDDFLNMVAGIQGSRMNDQRAELAMFPGLRNEETVMEPYRGGGHDGDSGGVSSSVAEGKAATSTADTLDDQFFEMLVRCQSSRLEDQRSVLPDPRSAPTVPDEDFFNLIQRVQSTRLDEQRSSMPRGVSPPCLVAHTQGLQAAPQPPVAGKVDKKEKGKRSKC